MNNAKILVKDPKNYEARAELSDADAVEKMLKEIDEKGTQVDGPYV